MPSNWYRKCDKNAHGRTRPCLSPAGNRHRSLCRELRPDSSRSPSLSLSTFIRRASLSVGSERIDRCCQRDFGHMSSLSTTVRHDDGVPSGHARRRPLISRRNSASTDTVAQSSLAQPMPGTDRPVCRHIDSVGAPLSLWQPLLHHGAVIRRAPGAWTAFHLMTDEPARARPGPRVLPLRDWWARRVERDSDRTFPGQPWGRCSQLFTCGEPSKFTARDQLSQPDCMSCGVPDSCTRSLTLAQATCCPVTPLGRKHWRPGDRRGGFGPFRSGVEANGVDRS